MPINPALRPGQRLAHDRAPIPNPSTRIRLDVLTCVAVVLLALAGTSVRGAVAAYTVELVPGWNAIAYQLDPPTGTGSGRLTSDLGLVPHSGDELAIWQCPAGAAELFTFEEDLGGWSPSEPVLHAGAGALYRNTSAGVSVWNPPGTPHRPVLPLSLPPGGVCLVAGQTNATADFEAITGFGPAEGTVVYRLNPGAAPTPALGCSTCYQTYRFTGGRWDPEPPVARVGEAVWIASPTNPPPAAVDLVLATCRCAEPFAAGSSFTYSIALLNRGPGPARGVLVKDILPPQATPVSAEPTQGTFGVAGAQLTWNVGTLASGASSSIEVHCIAAVVGDGTHVATASSEETDANPADNTASAGITVLEAPAIVVSPQDTVVRRGSEAVLAVTASGSAPLSYQWFHGGQAIPQANGSTLALGAARLADAGLYAVRIANPVGEVTSAATTLAVELPPIPPVALGGIWLGTDGVVHVRFDSDRAAYYLLRRATRIQGPWTPAGSSALGTGGSIELTDSAPPGTVGFYRVAALPVEQPLDLDGDGIDDVYELLHPEIMDPQVPAPPDLDSDGDGVSDLAEYRAGSDAGLAPGELRIRGLDIFAVTFPEPVRIGYGEGARTYQSALEFRVVVDPFPEADAAPVLRVGSVELRDHRALREAQGFTLAFYAYEPDQLTDGACIRLFRAPGGASELASLNCRVRYARQAYPLAAPLDEGPVAELFPSEPPEPRAWAGPAFIESPPVVGGPADYSGLRFALFDPQGRPLSELQVGDSLTLAMYGLPAGRQVEVRVVDDQQEWSFARLTADRAGNIPGTPIWYHTGVIGTTTRELIWQPTAAFRTFAEAEAYWASHRPRLEFRTPEGQPLCGALLRVVPRRTPLLYPSTADGVLLNAVDVDRSDPLHISGTHFPPGAKLVLFVVPDRPAWRQGDPLLDVTSPGGSSAPDGIELGPGQTSFTVPVWNLSRARPGGYDLVARVVDALPDPGDLATTAFELREADVRSYAEDTGVTLYTTGEGGILVEGPDLPATASPDSDGAGYSSLDFHPAHEPLFGAVRPRVVPQRHPGGEYAAYHVVRRQPASYWAGPSAALTDISGPNGSSQVEIVHLKFGSFGDPRKVIWPDPAPGIDGTDYEVIVDFGATPAGTASGFQPDGRYDAAVDFREGAAFGIPVPGLPGGVGARLVVRMIPDPAEPGPFKVGAGDYYETRKNLVLKNPAFDMTELANLADARNWLRIRYPAKAQGEEQPMPDGTDRYPLVLFLHGRHCICHGICMKNPCEPAEKRVASHRGYDYLLDTLASQGFIALSVDAFDLQESNAAANYEARARLILRHLLNVRGWDIDGQDPWGGILKDRIDMDRIGIVGHSRGGEAVVAADRINQDERATFGLGIRAVVAIAPTDQQAGKPWNIAHAPYFVLVPSADGDISEFHGLHTYDRAFRADPPAHNTQHVKAAAWIHGANHNYFNSVWTPVPGPFVPPDADPYADDDGKALTGPRLDVDEQQRIAATTIIGFLRWHLKGASEHEGIFTGTHQHKMKADVNHWSFQPPERLVIDDFDPENWGGPPPPPDKNQNLLHKKVEIHANFKIHEERQFDGSASHHRFTDGMLLGWDKADPANPVPKKPNPTYVTWLAADKESLDISTWDYLSFRITQLVDDPALIEAGKSRKLVISLVDATGQTARDTVVVEVPYPYPRTAATHPCVLETFRVPLAQFIGKGGIDPTKAQQIVFEFLDDKGHIGLDDIQLTH